MTKKQRIDEWVFSVDRIVTAYRKLDAACDAASKAGCLDPNGKLYNAIWKAFETAIDAADRKQWMHWFIFRNDCGLKAMEAKGPDDAKPKPIKTASHLAKILVQYEP